MPMLEIHGLDVAYGESQVLWDVSLQVPDSGVVCLMGRNGVGKTTLLKSIMGLLPVRAGHITFDGADLGGLRPEERAARGIGYVPQGREIFPRLKQLLSRKGGVLSGGEQQQLAVARVLLARPKLLLMDEPTEGIQPNVILQIEDAIGRIKERGIAVLLVEQYLEFAWRLANSYAIMRKGAIVSSGLTADLRHDVVRQHLTV